jgi:hypothetical protein
MEGQVREGKSYTHADALKVGFRVVPAADGSFVCYVGACECWGFTNVTDLLTWLQRAAQARQAAEAMQLTEAQVVQGVGGAVPGQRFMTKQDDIPPLAREWLMDGSASLSGTRRTTAVGSLADRLAAAEQPKGAA